MDSGCGIQKDLLEAYFWLAIANSQADFALQKQNALKAQLAPEELVKLEQRVKTWLAEHPRKPRGGNK